MQQKQTFNKDSVFYEFAKRMEQLHVDDIQRDKQGNIIFDESEQKERGGVYWKELEKKYGINFGDVVKIDNHLGRVQELYVSEESKDSNGLTKIEHFGEYVSEEAKDSNGLTGDRVSMRLYGGTELEDFDCAELGMTAKEWLKDIKVQPREKEKKLSITEKIKNTIKTKVQTFKKGGAAQRLANRRANEKTTNAQTNKPSASQSASQRLKNKRALHNTQGLER